MNGTITKVVFPHADELGSVPVLPATAPRGWDHEPVSEESEGVIAPDATLPSSIAAESSHAYIWEHAAAAAAVVRSIWNESQEGQGALAGMSSAPGLSWGPKKASAMVHQRSKASWVIDF